MLCVLDIWIVRRSDHSYGVPNGRSDGLWSQADGKLYINLPEWSVVIFSWK